MQCPSQLVNKEIHFYAERDTENKYSVFIFSIYSVIPFEGKPPQNSFSSLEKCIFPHSLIFSSRKQSPKAPVLESRQRTNTTLIDSCPAELILWHTDDNNHIILWLHSAAEVKPQSLSSTSKSLSWNRYLMNYMFVFSCTSAAIPQRW